MQNKHGLVFSLEKKVLNVACDFMVRAGAIVIFAPAARHGSFGCGGGSAG